MTLVPVRTDLNGTKRHKKSANENGSPWHFYRKNYFVSIIMMSFERVMNFVISSAESGAFWIWARS